MKNISHKVYWLIIQISRLNPVFRFVVDILAICFYKVMRKNRSFLFQGQKYYYFYHLYNRTIASERIIEIPIAHKMLKKYKGKNILEVGNVLGHYCNQPHDVLDKYEKGKGVINKDVINFETNMKYDLIISVSTMEHVGYSYGENLDLSKIPKGIKNLKRLLKPGGKFFVTLPIGYNPSLLRLILERKTGFTKTYYMKRTSYLNDWKQVSFIEIKNCPKYDTGFANSNALFIGEYIK